MIQFIPANIDVDHLLQVYPPVEIDTFKVHKLLYLIGCLSSIPAYNKKLEVVDGYVPLHTDILQRHVHNYRQYMDYLLRVGVLETDNHYIVNKKAKGYRFALPYRTTVLRPVAIRERALVCKWKKSHRVSSTMHKQYKHLFQWFRSDLRIHREPAMEYIHSELNKKLIHPELQDWDAKRKAHKDPYVQFTGAYVNIELLAAGDFYYRVDSNVKRLHSNLTNLPSALRNFLDYDGVPLIAVDLVNSQPFLSILLLQPDFWERLDINFVAPIIDIYNISSLFQAKNASSHSHKPNTTHINKQTTNPYIMSVKNAVMSAQSDFQRFIDLVVSGQFYEYMQAQLKVGDRLANRAQAKALMFEVLFSDNQNMSREKQAFRNLFPSVYEVFALIKVGDHTRLARLLQRIESHLFLNVMTKRIARACPKLPLYTIHDSIVTTVGNEEAVRQVMEEELYKAVGYLPALRTEPWEPDCSRLPKPQLLSKDGLAA